MRVNLITGGIVLALVAAFAVQRDYDTRLAGVFPDFVLAILAVFGVILVVRGFARPERSQPFAGVSLPMVFASMGILIAWVLLLGPFGFLPSGVVAFLAVTVFIRRQDFRPRQLLWDVPVAVVAVWACFLVFTRIFLVPLPVPFFFG